MSTKHGNIAPTMVVHQCPSVGESSPHMTLFGVVYYPDCDCERRFSVDSRHRPFKLRPPLVMQLLCWLEVEGQLIITQPLVNAPFGSLVWNMQLLGCWWRVGCWIRNVVSVVLSVDWLVIELLNFNPVVALSRSGVLYKQVIQGKHVCIQTFEPVQASSIYSGLRYYVVTRVLRCYASR